MTALRPDQVIDCFAARVTAGDLAELTAMYEPDAVYLPRPGHPVSGERLRAALAELLNLRPTMTGKLERARCSASAHR